MSGKCPEILGALGAVATGRYWTGAPQEQVDGKPAEFTDVQSTEGADEHIVWRSRLDVRSRDFQSCHRRSAATT